MSDKKDNAIEAALIQAAATLTVEYIRQNDVNERAIRAKALGIRPDEVVWNTVGGSTIAPGDLGDTYRLILTQLKHSYGS